MLLTVSLVAYSKPSKGLKMWKKKLVMQPTRKGLQWRYNECQLNCQHRAQATINRPSNSPVIKILPPLICLGSPWCRWMSEQRQRIGMRDTPYLSTWNRGHPPAKRGPYRRLAIIRCTPALFHHSWVPLFGRNRRVGWRAGQDLIVIQYVGSYVRHRYGVYRELTSREGWRPALS